MNCKQNIPDSSDACIPIGYVSSQALALVSVEFPVVSRVVRKISVIEVEVSEEQVTHKYVQAMQMVSS